MTLEGIKQRDMHNNLLPRLRGLNLKEWNWISKLYLFDAFFETTEDRRETRKKAVYDYCLLRIAVTGRSICYLIYRNLLHPLGLRERKRIFVPRCPLCFHV